MMGRVRVFLNCLVLGFFLIASSVRCEEDAAAAESESKEFVLTLTHSNFSDVLSKNDFIVVEFYAPWCGHCKKLAPEYEKAASILSSHDPPIVLAKVDANEEANKELATEQDIKGFPTLKIFRKGGNVIQEYKGPRDADGIVDYLKKQSGPASVEITSVEVANSFIDDKKVIIVGVFPKLSGEEFDNFTALAENLRSDYDFGHTHDAKLLPRGDSSVSGPLVRLFKPFDEPFVDSKEFHVDALKKFVEETSIPLVTIFNNDPANHPYVIKFFNSDSPKALFFFNFSNQEAESLRSNYRAVAEQNKGGDLSFLMGDLDASQGAFQYFGLKEDQVPLIIVQTNDGKKYLKPHVKPEDIAPWLKDYKDGKVSQYKKSEPIPQENNEPVKVVVADNLQDIVMSSDKNVLLEFYAPWCGHCKKLAPILDEVAISYENDANVLIAKFDATANDVPGDLFDVKGYPTVYFKSASGNVLPYDGERTKDEIIDFIEKNRDKTGQQPETIISKEKEEDDAGSKDEL